MYCGYPKRWVLEQILGLLLTFDSQEVVGEESIGTKMNDHDLFIGRLRSREPLHHIRH